MADRTKIEWTDATWNPIVGCSVLSPGCTNCYAMRLAGTRLKHHPSRQGLTVDTKAGPVWTGETRLDERALTQPLRWRRPRKIFVCAHSDLFHPETPDEWIDRVFAAMVLSPQHTFQVLTKRPERMREYMGRRDAHDLAHPAIVNAACLSATGAVAHPHVDLTVWPLPNVWLGVTAERQQEADERIPILLETPAAKRLVSVEPMLGAVDLTRLDMMTALGLEKDGLFPEHHFDALRGRSDIHPIHGADPGWPALDWVICGGESGPKARPMHPDWARRLRDQCAAARVPFLFKQWGEWLPFGQGGFTSWSGATGRAGNRLKRRDLAWPGIVHLNDGNGGPDHARIGPVETAFLDRNGILQTCRIGKRAAGCLLDGVEHIAFPVIGGAA